MQTFSYVTHTEWLFQMGSRWKILCIWFWLDMDDIGGGTENTPTKFAGDSEEQGAESFQAVRKPGSEFKIVLTPNETNEMEFSKNISKALHLGRGNQMNIYTVRNKCKIFRSTAEKKKRNSKL